MSRDTNPHKKVKKIGYGLLSLLALILILYLIEISPASLHETKKLYFQTGLMNNSCYYNTEDTELEKWLRGTSGTGCMYPPCGLQNNLEFSLDKVSPNFEFYNVTFCKIYVKEKVLAQGWLGNQYVRNSVCDLAGAFVKVKIPNRTDSKITFREAFFVLTPEVKKFNFDNMEIQFSDFRDMEGKLELGLNFSYWKKLKPFSDFISDPVSIISSTISKLWPFY